MIESVSACGWSCTADSTATRGRVTRRATPRNMRSKSDVVGTPRSVAQLLELLKNQASVIDLMFSRGRHATQPVWKARERSSRPLQWRGLLLAAGPGASGGRQVVRAQGCERGLDQRDADRHPAPLRRIHVDGPGPPRSTC